MISLSGSIADVALVAVEAHAPRSCARAARLRVDGGDHPVGGDPAGDAKHPVGIAGRGPGRPRWPAARAAWSTSSVELAPVQRRHQRHRVAGQRIHQRPGAPRVVVVTHRLTRRRCSRRRGTAAPAARSRSSASAHLQQGADRRTDQRDRVHRGHRVIQRGRVQHPPHAPPARPPWPPPAWSRRSGRPIGAGQPGAHVHQHRVHKPRIVEIQAAGGVLPARVEGEPLHRLPIRAAPQTAAAPSPPPRSSAARSAGPTSVNRSANISSGNKSKHSRCSTP